MQNSKARRYPPRLVEFVRRLGEQGYRVCDARAAVAKLGVDPLPAERTIKRWLDPDFAEADRMSQRRGRLPGPQPRKRWTWQRKLERLRELRALGISLAAVAKVMNHDYALRLTPENVRHLIADDYPEDSVERLMRGYELRRGRRPVASKSDGRHHQRQAGPSLQASA